jgi:hypothetical protein
MSGREINEERLRLVARRLGRQRAIERVDTFPPEKPDRVVAHFVSPSFPSQIESVRLELRLRYDGDWNCHYIESWPGGRWECRWDRHDNPHSTRDHFHPPPTVDDTRAIDCTHPDGIADVVTAVLGFVERRIGDLWVDDEPVYPDEYDFAGEYGPTG